MRTWLAIAATFALASIALAADFVDVMRGPVPIGETTAPPALNNAENKDIRRERTYFLQPPTIPHKIDNYQLDKNANRCMFCHARTKAEQSKAIPVSITHYMDRDGNLLADISPRRYFCDTCHVVQLEVKPLVESNYEDVEDILKREMAKKPAPKKK
ncbi:MAG TPA: nitrate reductase cytochrome c-type subunit [Burkholderiales bacterium]|nr:nitrate reductase cytochrome c-type subunit [Burkholderiales bacterium]